jgi:hypothetical protein
MRQYRRENPKRNKHVCKNRQRTEGHTEQNMKPPPSRPTLYQDMNEKNTMHPFQTRNFETNTLLRKISPTPDIQMNIKNKSTQLIGYNKGY